MKKNFKIYPFLIGFCLSIFYSCEKEVNFERAESNFVALTIDEAKILYGSEMKTRSVSSEKGVGFKNRDFDDSNIVPLWESAKSHIYNGQSYLEVPFNLRNDKKFLFYSKSKDDLNSIPPTNDKKSEGLFRLIFERKKDGSKVGYYFLAFGDSNNVVKSGKTPILNVFGEKTGFSGFEEFHFLNGEFSHAWQHKIDNSLTANLKPKLQTRLLEQVCTAWTYRVCSSYGCDTFFGGYDCHWIDTGSSSGSNNSNPCAICGTNNASGGGSSSSSSNSNDGMSISMNELETFLWSNCESWDFEQKGNLQVCGVSGMFIDFFFDAYDNGSKVTGISTISFPQDIIYYEMPYRRADGTTISKGEAANLCAKWYNQAENYIEKNWANKFPQGQGEKIRSQFLGELNRLMKNYGGRATKNNNYNARKVNPYDTSTTPTNCN
jgi:hypothetical protein